MQRVWDEADKEAEQTQEKSEQEKQQEMVSKACLCLCISVHSSMSRHTVVYLCTFLWMVSNL